MALAYSVRFSRWSSGRPGLGLASGGAIQLTLEPGDEILRGRESGRGKPAAA